MLNDLWKEILHVDKGNALCPFCRVSRYVVDHSPHKTVHYILYSPHYVA